MEVHWIFVHIGNLDVCLKFQRESYKNVRKLSVNPYKVRKDQEINHFLLQKFQIEG